MPGHGANKCPSAALRSHLLFSDWAEKLLLIPGDSGVSPDSNSQLPRRGHGTTQYQPQGTGWRQLTDSGWTTGSPWNWGQWRGRGTQFLITQTSPSWTENMGEARSSKENQSAISRRRREKSWAIKTDSCPLHYRRTPTRGLLGPTPPPPASASAPESLPPEVLVDSRRGACHPVYTLYHRLRKTHL